ncbi:hypothetical protein VNO77_48825 [Canavalia gladiata]|uniref:Uncharacterized protein n=1 Tax=Canavalia gladiata TaxID=3824 RepID=A0AAN9PFF7_CANGL
MSPHDNVFLRGARCPQEGHRPSSFLLCFPFRCVTQCFHLLACLYGNVGCGSFGGAESSEREGIEHGCLFGTPLCSKSVALNDDVHWTLVMSSIIVDNLACHVHVTINNNTGLIESGNWNEYNLNPLTRIHWRASLVPAAAVIPAPIARTTAKAFAKDVFINQERKLGARRRSDTVLVSTINDADQGSADVAFRTPLAPYEKSKSLGSGGSMVARLKLKGIDGRAPPGVEPAA